MPRTDKEYQKIYHKQWYAKNSEQRIKQIHERRFKIRKWFQEYKSHCKCKTCGESHPATLDFHHLDQSEKILEVSVAIRNGWSIEKIKIEIEKCDILCSNCHRKEHWNESI